MKTWPVQDAKARFSELLETCLREGPQLVTRRGEKAAVLVPAAQWQQLADAGKPTLKDLLLTDVGRFDLPIPRAARSDGIIPRAFARPQCTCSIPTSWPSSEDSVRTARALHGCARSISATSYFSGDPG